MHKNDDMVKIPNCLIIVHTVYFIDVRMVCLWGKVIGTVFCCSELIRVVTVFRGFST